MTILTHFIRSARRFRLSTNESSGRTYREKIKHPTLLAVGASALFGCMALDIHTNPTNSRRHLVLSKTGEKLLRDPSYESSKTKILPSTLPDHHAMTMRLTQVSGRVISSSSLNDVPLCIYVTNQEGFGAFSIASSKEGMICFYQGALDVLDTDDALAFVFSHELEHILCRHMSEDLAYPIFSALAITPVVPTVMRLGVLSGVSAILVWSALATVAFVLGVVYTMYLSPKLEIESDLCGLRLASRGGYDPDWVIRTLMFFENCMTYDEKRWFPTHPSPRKRLSTVFSSDEYREAIMCQNLAHDVVKVDSESQDIQKVEPVVEEAALILEEVSKIEIENAKPEVREAARSEATTENAQPEEGDN